MALAPVRLHSTDASKDALRPPITRVDVRYAPDSGGKADIAGGPDSASNRHYACDYDDRSASRSAPDLIRPRRFGPAFKKVFHGWDDASEAQQRVGPYCLFLTRGGSIATTAGPIRKPMNARSPAMAHMKKGKFTINPGVKM